MGNVSGFVALEGLSDEEVIALYSVARQRTMQRGEVLLQQEGKASVAFLVLDGMVEVRRQECDRPRLLAILRPGEWAGMCRFPKETGAPAGLVAREDGAVLEFTTESLDALSEPLRNIANERLAAYPRVLGQALARRQETLVRRTRYLRGYVDGLLDGVDDYSSSRLITAIIDKVPALPVYAARLMSMLHDDDVSAREVVDVAKEDPSLVAAILKEVNSAAYGLPNPVSDLKHAITLLGFNQIHRLVLKEGIRRVMPDKPAFRELQDHSICVSHLAYELAGLAQAKQRTRISTIALLHDIGKSLLLLLQEGKPELALFVRLLDHARLGTMLLKKWNIPEVVWRPIELQRMPEYSAPDELPEAFRYDTGLLYLAHRCDEFLANSDPDAGAASLAGDFSPEYLRDLGIDARSVPDLTNRVLLPLLKKTKWKFQVRI